MKKTTMLVCGASLVLAVVCVVAALVAQTYWFWGYDSWGMYGLVGLTEFLFFASAAMLALAGIIKLAEFNSKLIIATLSLLLISYLAKQLDLSAFAPNSARESQEKYVFTTDWVTVHESAWSETLKKFKGRPNVRAVEIGSFEGRSAIWFLENILTRPSSTITCIDVFDGPIERLFDTNLSGFKNKVRKIKATSHEALRTLQANSFDFIYIDGSHAAKDVFLDAALSWDLLKPGGIIIFDDYEWTGQTGYQYGPGLLPKSAIDAFLKVFEPYLEVQHKEYQLIVRKRERVDRNSPQLQIVVTKGT